MNLLCGGVAVDTVQTAVDRARWENLCESFIALGNLLHSERVHIAISAEEQAREVYRSVYQQVCQFCSKARWCWGEEKDYTLESLGDACNRLMAEGLHKESVFQIKFQGRCSRARQLELVLFNQIAWNQQYMHMKKQRDETTANISQQLILLGEQMKLVRNHSNRCDHHSERLVVGHAGSRKESISGDSWGVVDLQDGRFVQILCDGMGSGPLAMEQSNIAVQLLKTLLSGGLSVRLSANIMNTVLTAHYNGIRFSTVDVAIWNLNTKKIELYKYGAAPSFVCNHRQICSYVSDSLPVGIISRVEGNIAEHTMQHGDLLIMMSDGLYELTNQHFRWEDIICRIPTTDPQLMAEYLLAIAISRSRGNQKLAELQAEKSLAIDDMTILVSKLI